MGAFFFVCRRGTSSRPIFVYYKSKFEIQIAFGHLITWNENKMAFWGL